MDQMVSPSEQTLDRARTPSPHPSAHAASLPFHKVLNFDSSGSDDIVEMPNSSSPPTSSPGATLTPPQDGKPTDHLDCINEFAIVPVDFSNEYVATIATRAPLRGFVKEGASDTRIYSTSSTPSPSHLERAIGADEDMDHSSGSSSWIEDYVDHRTNSQEADAVEFATLLDAKLARVLEQRSRINALSPSEEISPYSRDLRARAAGLPVTTFDRTPPEAVSQTFSCPIPAAGPTLELATNQDCTTTKLSLFSDSSADKENAPSSAYTSSSVVFEGSFGAVDNQHPRTPNPEKNTATPHAPRKALRHMRISGPRERPPTLVLPFQTLDCAVSPDSQPSNADVFIGDSLIDRPARNPNAYSQASGTKRPPTDHIEEVAKKKRKVNALKHSGRNRRTVSDNTEARDILAKLLNPGAFPSRRASLRKAASLRSEASAIEETSPSTHIKGQHDAEPSLQIQHVSLTQQPSHVDPGDSIQPSMIYPTTQPATPIRMNSRANFQTRFREQMRSPDSLPYPLPILAPPLYVEIPRAAIMEEVAEARLIMMMNKEQEERNDDGLLDLDPRLHVKSDSRVSPHAPGCETDDELDDDSEDEETQVNKPVYKRGRRRSILSTDDNEKVFDWPFEHQICIDDEFRQEAVKWILDVTPPEFRSKPSVGKHLREQLIASPDTRWHAAQLFNRYFIRIGSSPPSSPVSPYGELTGGRKVTSEDERASFVWDIALACLALSVKFHRDVLGPFFPVLSNEFLVLASHDIEYEDLEAAQRDVFSGFSFCVGSVTPGAYIQELWEALPSLQTLLSFAGGLEAAKRATWEVLYDSLFELSYFKFPTSLLTACALVLGIIDTLILKSRVDTAVPLQNRTARWRSRRGARCDCDELRKAAEKKVKDVECDLREVLGLTTNAWEACLHWLKTLLNGH